MKKLVTAASIGIEVPYEGPEKDLDLALIDVTEKGERYGKAVLLSSADLNEGIAQASEEAAEKIDGGEIKGEEITITPSKTQQVITPSEGKNAIIKATVEAVTAGVDENITQENIKKGVTVLGVQGLLDETIPILESKVEFGMPLPDNPEDALAGLDGHYALGLLRTLHNYNPSSGYNALLLARQGTTDEIVWKCYLDDLNTQKVGTTLGSMSVAVTIESEAPASDSTSVSESGGGVIITTVNYLLKIVPGCGDDLEVQVTAIDGESQN